MFVSVCIRKRNHCIYCLHRNTVSLTEKTKTKTLHEHSYNTVKSNAALGIKGKQIMLETARIVARFNCVIWFRWECGGVKSGGHTLCSSGAAHSLSLLNIQNVPLANVNKKPWQWSDLHITMQRNDKETHTHINTIQWIRLAVLAVWGHAMETAIRKISVGGSGGQTVYSRDFTAILPL